MIIDCKIILGTYCNISVSSLVAISSNSKSSLASNTARLTSPPKLGSNRRSPLLVKT